MAGGASIYCVSVADQVSGVEMIRRPRWTRGRGASEVMNLTAGNIVHEGDKVFYEYRGKGGKTGKRELPRPAYEAIVGGLAAWSKDLATMSQANRCGRRLARSAESRAARSMATCGAT